MIVIIMFSVSVVSCNKGKNNSKDSSGAVMDDKTEVSKEDAAMARIKALDSILKVMKDESPYPNDMKVLSIKEVDSVTNAEVATALLSNSYLQPQIIPELKRRALDKSTVGYIMNYKLRYRVNDMSVVVTDFAIVLSKKNQNMYSANYKMDRSSIVYHLTESLRKFLLDTTKA